jgi:hypothetical protein
MRSTRTTDARKAEAYRVHVIESSFSLHVTGTMFAIVAPVVNKLRNPGFMTLFDALPWVDFREVFAVTSYVLLLCLTHARSAYVQKYELACETLNWLGMLGRCTTARHKSELPWGVIRLGSVVASAVGARYERRKQWRMTCVRLACAGVIDAHLKKKHHAQYSDVPMRGLLVHEMVEGAFYAVLCLGTQFWLERIDLRNFEETW